MDKVDKLLINLLQENARYSLKELAEQVYLSSPAVASRIEKLEASGIISGYHADVNSKKLGYHITAYIDISMEPKKKKEFIPFIEKYPNALECCAVAGESSVVLKVTFPSTEDLELFIGKVQEFGTTKTKIVLSEIVPHRGVSVRA